MAALAGFDANVVELAGGVYRQLVDILFAASGTQDPAEVPLGRAERADKGAFSAIAFFTQHTGLGFFVAKRGMSMASSSHSHH